MRELLVTTFLSLDGVMQAPGGPDEDPSGGFDLGGWSSHYFDDEVGEEMEQLMAEPFDLLLGRRKNDIFAGFWPSAPADEELDPAQPGDQVRGLAGYPELTWDTSVLVTGDVAEAVSDLKQTGGPQLQVHGSGDLVQTLLRAGLVDRWHLVIFPVLLGSGRRLFSDGTIPASLRLVEGRVTKGGTIIGTYVPAGDCGGQLRLTERLG